MPCNKYHKVLLAKDVGTAIHKSIMMSFLPCLVAFLGFHPYMVPHFFLCFLCNLFLLFFCGEKCSMQRYVVINHDLIAENSMFSSDV